MLSAQEPVAKLHGEFCMDVQVCSWPAGCFSGMLPARVGPNEKVSTRLNALRCRKSYHSTGVSQSIFGNEISMASMQCVWKT